MEVKTTECGALRYDDSTIIHFPEGMLGFVHFKKFVLLELEETRPLRWLQSVEEPSLAFPVLDPSTIFPNYDCTPSSADLLSLQIENPADMLTLAVAIIPEDPARTTVNLKAPVLINYKRMLGKQVVLTDTSSDVWTPLVEQA